jgi:hypothetical protein
MGSLLISEPGEAASERADMGNENPSDGAVQAAGIEIPCLFFKRFSMAALSRAGGTIMKRRLIML